MSLKWMCRIVAFMLCLNLTTYGALLRQQGHETSFRILFIATISIGVTYGRYENRMLKKINKL